MNTKELIMQITQDLSDLVSSKRLEHILRVKKLSEELALYYNLDPEKLALVALLHDSTKEFNNEILIKIMQDYFPEHISMHKNIYHQFTSMLYAKNHYKITDCTILEAIQYHTTGHPLMGDLAKVFFIADYIEPGREAYEGVIKAREYAYTNLDLACFYKLDYTLKFQKSKESFITNVWLEAAHKKFYKICFTNS